MRPISRPALTFAGWLRYDLLRRILGSLKQERARMLEIGPGVGAFGARAAALYTNLGVERNWESAVKAAAAVQPLGGAVICGDEACLRESAKFDLICAFEVLEHIEDDLAALCTWRRHLADGGKVLLSVPALQRRFGPSDKRVGHFRRYDPGTLAETMQRAGLHVLEMWSYGFPLGLFLEQARNAIARSEYRSESMQARTARSGRMHQPHAWLGPFTAAFTYPWCVWQRAYHHRPLGHGLIVLAEQRSNDRPSCRELSLPPGLCALGGNAQKCVVRGAVLNKILYDWVSTSPVPRLCAFGSGFVRFFM